MTSERLPPLISIGMPIRNEARFLQESLESLVSQTGVTIEIIISDNASTDDSAAICKRFCTSYPHIRYHRFEHNVGLSTNFNYVLQEAKGDYFMWASGHDLWDSNYLAACSQVLEAYPAAVIAFGSTRWIDAKGNPYPKASGWCDTRGMSLVGRYFAVFWGNMHPIVAMIRTRELQRHKFDDMVGVDLAILLNLALVGDFVHACETGWCRREFRIENQYQQKLDRYRNADYALNTSWLGRHFPLTRLPARILGNLFASGLTFGQKILIMLILLPSLPIKYIVERKRNAGQQSGDGKTSP